MTRKWKVNTLASPASSPVKYFSLVEKTAWYRMDEGKPCFEVQYFLDQEPEHPETHVDKDGTYAALVNVETGVIEKLVYESGMGGEG